MATILVVDDDAMLRGFTARMLHTLGYQVTEAVDGEEGERLALSRQPDLILLDIMMPNQNGWETCQRLRAQGFMRPIFLMSAFLPGYTSAKIQTAGATAFIEKPITRVILQKHFQSVGQSQASSG